MTIVQLTERQGRVPGYQYTETISNGATGDTVIIPPMGTEGAKITCTMIAGANTGKLQFTTSLDSAVAAGTCTWQDWPKGNVTGTDYDALTGPVTALRGVSIAGEIKIEIVA